MEINNVPEKHYVELTALENAFLKSGVMLLLAGLMNDQTTAAIAVIGGRGVLQELGQDGLTALTEKMEAHRRATTPEEEFGPSIQTAEEFIAEVQRAAGNLNPSQEN